MQKQSQATGKPLRLLASAVVLAVTATLAITAAAPNVNRATLNGQDTLLATSVPAPVSDNTPQTLGDQNSPANASAPNTPYYKVVFVVDGDTIKVAVGSKTETVRLIGVGTPELHDPRKPVQCFGQEASDYTKSKLQNSVVQLEGDSSQQNRDKYGRLLRYIMLQDGTNFNKQLIKEGFGFEYTFQVPYKYQAEFKAAQVDAKYYSRGLWSPTTCNGKHG